MRMGRYNPGMSEDALLSRIEKVPHVISGRPKIVGQRVTVDHVVGMLISGMTPRQIVEQHPGMVELDVHAAVAWTRRFLLDVAQRIKESDQPGVIRTIAADWTETEERLLAMAIRLSQPVFLDMLHAHEAAIS